MNLFDCIKHIYSKSREPILKSYLANDFQFSAVILFKMLALDAKNLRSLSVLSNDYLYMEPRDAVLVAYLLVPKGRPPYLKIPEKIPCKIPTEWYTKSMRVLGWSEREANYNEDIIQWFYTNNKDYFNNV